MQQARRFILGVLVTIAIVAPATAAPPDPRTGGTLVVRTFGDPGTLNGGITTASITHAVADSIYNGLIQLDAQFKVNPDLAERWTISPDGRTYTFTLARGVRWHDGHAFSSADVKFTYEQVLLKYHARTRAGLAGVLESIETPSPSTVVFQFKRSFGAFLRRADVTEKTGWMDVELVGDAGEIDRAVAGLKRKGVKVDLIERNIIE